MTVPAFEPSAQELFPDFYANPSIQLLADRAKWTVSDNEKVPIDIREFEYSGGANLWGAKAINENHLATLSELTHILPNAANNAYYLQAHSDGFLVLDIEKTCPPEIAAELLGMSEALYSELSMSGKGYHLLMPLPSNFHEYPLAAGKKVLKEEHGYYEILLDHWITFTRQEIPDDRYLIDENGAFPDAPFWDDFYAGLAQKAKEVLTKDLDVHLDKPVIPSQDTIIELMTRLPHNKSLEEYHNDCSRWEFAIMGYLYNKLASILVAIHSINEHDYTENERVWLLFLAAQQVLPHRPKHDGYRNEMPVLMSMAATLISQRLAEKPKDK